MENKKVTADNYGIIIHHPPEQKYVIGWWQIELHGFTHWLDHLKEKRWFTDAHSRRFSELCIEHYRWN